MSNLTKSIVEAMTPADMEKVDQLDALDRSIHGFPVLDEQPLIDIRQWPVLGEDALHGVIGEAVRMIEPHSESDTAAVLAQSLIAWGSMAGRTSCYQVEADRHYPNEYCVLVGDTAGGRKGTAWGQARLLLESVDDFWMNNRITGGLSSGEGVVFAVRNSIAKKEAVREDHTVTGYQEVITDHGVDDKRLLIVESEFSNVLAVMAREGNNLSSIIRNGWDRGDIECLTKNNPLKATGAHISIIGHITKDELLRRLTATDTANGFANRILWICVRRSKSLPEGGRISEVDFRDVRHRLVKALDFSRKGNRIVLSPEARTIWHAVYPKLSEGRPGLLGAVLSRAEAHTIRLSLIYALLDCSPEIKQEHIKAALSLWEYCEESARYIFEDRLGDPLADDIMTALRAAGPAGLTRTEISEYFGRNRKAVELRVSLGVLLRGGLAHFTEVSTGGRSAERWFIGVRKNTK